MSDSDIRGKVEDILNKILSRKYNAEIKIKFVDSEGSRSEQGRNNHGACRNDTYAGAGNQ